MRSSDPLQVEQGLRAEAEKTAVKACEEKKSNKTQIELATEQHYYTPPLSPLPGAGWALWQELCRADDPTVLPAAHPQASP